MQPRMRGFIPDRAPRLAVTANESGSHKEDDVLVYMERVPAPRQQSSPWRLLMVDAYAAQTADVVGQFAWQRGYALRVHGGGATGV